MDIAKLYGLIEELPDGRLGKEVLLTDNFLVSRFGDLTTFFAPLDTVNSTADVMVIGITPGWMQMAVAFEAARDAMRSGVTDVSRVSAAAKAAASFAGMRDRLIRWLDLLGVNDALGVHTSSELFEGRRERLHTTSALRYPVFKGSTWMNYTGHAPRITRSHYLMDQVKERLYPEIRQVEHARLVPLGMAVSEVLKRGIASGVVGGDRCLIGFPHPSGANGHATAQFGERAEELRTKVHLWASDRPGG